MLNDRSSTAVAVSNPQPIESPGRRHQGSQPLQDSTSNQFTTVTPVTLIPSLLSRLKALALRKKRLGGCSNDRSRSTRQRHSSRRSKKTTRFMAYKLIWSPTSRRPSRHSRLHRARQILTAQCLSDTNCYQVPADPLYEF